MHESCLERLFITESVVFNKATMYVKHKTDNQDELQMENKRSLSTEDSSWDIFVNNAHLPGSFLRLLQQGVVILQCTILI